MMVRTCSSTELHVPPLHPPGFRRRALELERASPVGATAQGEQRWATVDVQLDRRGADGRSAGGAVSDNEVLPVSALLVRRHDPVGERRVERRAASRTPWRRPMPGGGALVVGRRLQRGPHSRRVDSQAPKDLPRRPLDIEKAEQDVFGLDMVLVAAEREPRRPLQGSFGAVGEGKIARVAIAFGGNGLGNLLSGPFEGHSGGHQRPRCTALALRHDPEEKVLGPDVAVTESPGLLLRKSDDPAGTVAESLEHARDRRASRNIMRGPGGDRRESAPRTVGSSGGARSTPALERNTA